MTGYVCTVAGGKGGVGKTTTAVNIAAVFESEGYDTVVVDADLGMANMGEMLDLEFEQSIHEVLAGEAAVSDALTTGQGGTTVVPGEQSLEAFAEADPAKLRKVIKTLQNTHDVVLVDTAAGLTNETTVPLGLADGILLLTTPDDVAVRDTGKTVGLVDRLDGTVLGVLVTRATAETDVDAIESRLAPSVLGVIPNDTDATSAEPLVENAPDRDVADAYKQVTGILQHVFFEGGDPDSVQQVYDPSWFGAESTAEDDPDEAADEEDDDGGYTHSVFHGI